MRRQWNNASLRKETVRCVLASAAAAVMLLCTEQPVFAGETDNQQKTITLWAWDNTFNVKAAQMAEEIYEERYPEIDVQVVSMERNEILQSVQNNLAAGFYEELPEIILIEDYQAQEMLSGYRGEFFSLEDRIDFSGFLDYKASMECFEGTQYGLPFDSGTAVLLYRKDYIEEAGYTEQDMENLTWERFMEIGEAVKEKTGKYLMTIQPTDLGVLRIMLQSTGNWYVKQDGITADIADNPVFESVLDIYQELFSRNLVLTITAWDQFVEAFQSGKVASVVSGCWSISSVKANPEQSGLWRIARIPRMEGAVKSVNASNIGGSGWYVLKNSKYPEEAADFLAEMFVEDTEFLRELEKEINIVYPLKDQSSLGVTDWEDPFFGNQKVKRFLADTLPDILPVNYGMHTYEIEEVMTEGLQDFFRGTPKEEILKKVQIKANAIT